MYQREYTENDGVNFWPHEINCHIKQGSFKVWRLKLPYDDMRDGRFQTYWNEYLNSMSKIDA